MPFPIDLDTEDSEMGRSQQVGLANLISGSEDYFVVLIADRGKILLSICTHYVLYFWGDFNLGAKMLPLILRLMYTSIKYLDCN